MPKFDEKKLIFIISQPRSGSTLLQKILWQHSKIHTIGEPYFAFFPLLPLSSKAETITDFAIPKAYQQLKLFLDSDDKNRTQFQKDTKATLLNMYGRAMQGQKEIFFLDKSPKYHNVLPELQELFPEATYIYLIRHPLSVLASLMKWSKVQWSHLRKSRDDLEEGPRTIIRALSEHKNKSNHIKIHFEELVKNPQKQISILLSVIGLEFEPDMLDYQKDNVPEGGWNVSGNTGSFDHIENSSADAWQKYFKTPQLKLLAKGYMKNLGDDTLNQFGYELSETSELLRKPKYISFLPPVFSWPMLMKPKLSLLTRNLIFIYSALSWVEWKLIRLLRRKDIYK